MEGNPAATLHPAGKGGRRCLVASLDSSRPLQRLCDQVKKSGAFLLAVREDQPPSPQIPVVLRIDRQEETFTATILAWTSGVAVLKPNLGPGEFENLLQRLSETVSPSPPRSDSQTAIQQGTIEQEPSRGIPSATDRQPSAPEKKSTASQTAPTGVRKEDLEVCRGEREPGVLGSGRGASGEIRLPSPHGPDALPSTTAPVSISLDDLIQDAESTPASSVPVTAEPPIPEVAPASAPQLSSVEHPTFTPFVPEAAPEADRLTRAPVGQEPSEEVVSPADRKIGDKMDAPQANVTIPQSVSLEDLMEVTGDSKKSQPVSAAKEVSEQLIPFEPTSKDRVEQPRPRKTAPPQQQEPEPVASGPFPLVPKTTPDGDAANQPLQLAHSFLECLDLAMPPLAEGIADGSEVLDTIEETVREKNPCVLIAQCPDQQEKWYFFVKAGTITDAYRLPASPKYALTFLLSGQDLIPPKALPQVLHAAAEKRISEEVAMAEFQLMDLTLLRRAIRAKVKLLTSAIAVKQSLSFQLHGLNAPPPILGLSGTSDLKDFHAIVRQNLQKTWTQMAEEQEPYLASFPTLSLRADLISHNLGLDSKMEHFVSSCLTGSESLRNIYRITGLTRAKTFAVLFALKEMGLLRFCDTPSQIVSQSKRQEAIQRHYGSISQANDFEILNLHWTATQPEIDQAAARLQEEYSAQRCRDLNETARKQAAALSARIGEAYRNLRSIDQRRRYRSTLLEEFEVDKAIDMIIGQLTMAVFRRDIPLVRRLLDQIEELRPRVAPVFREKVRGQLGDLLDK